MLSFVLTILLSPWSVLAAIAAYLLYRRMMAPFQFFAQRGVQFSRPSLILGNFGNMMLMRESIYDMVVNSYNKFGHKRFYGMYDFSQPLLTIRDPQLIRQITVKDFDHFVDHRPFFANSKAEPLFGRTLFMLTGKKWRDMRATLSPAFTGSKMRQMFQLVVECADQATQMLRAEAAATAPLPLVPEMKDLFTRFTNDVIATAAFGISVNSLRDRNNAFYTMGTAISGFSLTAVVKMLAISVCPRLALALGIHMFSGKQTDFYRRLVHDTIEVRQRDGIHRPDMIHLLMQARQGTLAAGAPADDADDGFAVVDEVPADAASGSPKTVWDDDDVTAQCFLFFIAGFETSATLLCFAAHELMENPAVQRRLLAELDETRERLAGQPLSWEALQKMRYLDQVVSETLRKWPPAITMDRQCRKSYQLTDETGHSVQLQPGDAVWIPVIAIQRDPQYWPQPDRFDPERFSEERKAAIQPFTYLPFGAGPRNCIGSRFALMECKAMLYYLLASFTFEVAASSTVPLVLEPSSFSLRAKNGFNIHLKPRL